MLSITLKQFMVLRRGWWGIEWTIAFLWVLPHSMWKKKKKYLKTHPNKMPVWRHRCSVNDRKQRRTMNGKRQLANCRPSVFVLALIFHWKWRWIEQHAHRCIASTACVASRENCLGNEYVGMYIAGAQIFFLKTSLLLLLFSFRCFRNGQMIRMCNEMKKNFASKIIGLSNSLVAEVQGEQQQW